ncbi:MAG: hypothetical protein LUC93_01940 [Planctomycetaceae bacterium]|nr:hypothetical protein [Planctomycetaceae bacterium]
MKKVLLAAIMSLVLGATAMAATPVAPAVPGPAEQTVAQQNAALAPDATLATDNTLATTTVAPTTTRAPPTPSPPTTAQTRSIRRRPMEVIGVIIAIAVIVGIAAWAMRRRRTDVHRTDIHHTNPNRVDDVTVPHHNVHNDRPVGIN